MSSQRYWFNTRSMRVESDDDRGPMRYLLGPYPSREHAAHALERAQKRTQEWEEQDRRWAAGERPAWTEPVRLGRFERWVLAHRGRVRTVAVLVAVLMVGVFVRDVRAAGEASFLPLLLAVQSLTVLVHVRGLENRAEAAAKSTAGAS